MQQPNINIKSDFSHLLTIEEVEGKSVPLVQIVDRDLGGKSVTNDAENVVDWVRIALKEEAKLDGDRFSMADCAVMYRDSMGHWDEIVIGNDGRFLTFSRLPGPDGQWIGGDNGPEIIKTLCRRWLARRAAE